MSEEEILKNINEMLDNKNNDNYNEKYIVVDMYENGFLTDKGLKTIERTT